MYPRITKLFFALLMLLPTIVLALPSDREQPIDIEADQATLDDKQGFTEYKGRAILTQGTLRIEGDSITFYYDENRQLTKAVAKGKPATYQQLHKQGDDVIRASALTMEYYQEAQEIHLIKQANVWQAGNEFSGDFIKYDITNDVVTAKAIKQTTDPDTTTSAPTSGRVRVTIHPPGSKKSPSTATEEPTAPTIEQKSISGPSDNTVQQEDKDNSIVYAITTLNVRNGPGTQYNKLGTFEMGSELTILTEQKDWIQVKGTIENQAVIGWVSRRYVQTN